MAEDLDHQQEESSQATTLEFRPRDETDPRNWLTGQNLYASTILVLICFAINFAAGIYAASIPSIALNLKISEELAISGLGLFALGVGLGPVIAAPIFEIFGRKVIYLFSLPLAIVFLAGVGTARNFQTISVLRILAGFVGSPVLAIRGGTIADVWDLKTEPMGGLMLVLFVTFVLAGAELGPTAGCYILENRGWRWAFWLPIIICGGVV